MNSQTRTYTMTARARSTEQTRQRILDATVSLHLERLAADVGLDHVAERAGVSVQTVLRHFGSRAALVERAFAHAQAEIREEREAAPGDVDEAVRVLVDHYERRGDGVLLLLAQESTHELARKVTSEGRALHRQWVTEVFAPYVAGADEPDQLVDLLVVATDVYTWKLLRRDRGLSRETTQARIHALVGSLLTRSPSPEQP